MRDEADVSGPGSCRPCPVGCGLSWPVVVLFVGLLLVMVLTGRKGAEDEEQSEASRAASAQTANIEPESSRTDIAVGGDADAPEASQTPMPPRHRRRG